MLKMKRIYDEPARSDGYRVFVDRLWPRGMSKSDAHFDEWLKDIAPSDELRRFYAHDVSKWTEFKKRYFQELSGKEELVSIITEKAEEGTVTLLFSARDEEHSNAAALKEYIEHKI